MVIQKNLDFKSCASGLVWRLVETNTRLLIVIFKYKQHLVFGKYMRVSPDV